MAAFADLAAFSLFLK
ncbi:hypothetical protein A2U01_0110465, partial [Trifolium medium]|nr:hypothetical protein [Trifolium medium]